MLSSGNFHLPRGVKTMEEKIVTLAEFPLIDFVELVNMVFPTT